MSEKLNNYDMINHLQEVSSIVALMGWAAVGQDYAGCKDSINCPSGFDYENAARVVGRLIDDVCGDLEALGRSRGVKDASK